MERKYTIQETSELNKVDFEKLPIPTLYAKLTKASSWFLVNSFLTYFFTCILNLSTNFSKIYNAFSFVILESVILRY